MTEDVFDPKTDEETVEDQTTTETSTDISKVEKRLADKDTFIDQLKAEAAEMRAALAQGDKAEQELDALRDEIKRLKEPQAEQTPRGHTSPSLTESDIETLVAGVMTKREQAASAVENRKASNDALVAVYGDAKKAKEALEAKAAALNLSVDKVRDIAVQSPTAFKELMGISGKAPQRTIDKNSTVNTQALGSGDSAAPGTKAYFNNLRKEIGNSKFFQPDILSQVIAAKKAGTYDS